MAWMQQAPHALEVALLSPQSAPPALSMPESIKDFQSFSCCSQAHKWCAGSCIMNLSLVTKFAFPSIANLMEVGPLL